MVSRLLLLASFCCLAGCGSPQPQLLELAGRSMGTSWSVKLVVAADHVPSDALLSHIQAELEQVNDEMSTYRADSALSRFNSSRSNNWQDVPANLVTVVQEAQRTSLLSEGAYDVTIGPLVNLWGFGADGSRDHVPDDAQVKQALARVGYQKLVVREQPPALRKLIPGLYVDLSSIAKGYAVDRVADLVAAAGYPDYLVEIGGELRSRGRNVHGDAWRIAVEKPDDLGRQVQEIVALSGVAMATSGDYRNFFVDQGQRYSHTIDPATGRPVKHSLAAVSVIAPTCMRADALSTALMSLGPERGLAMAEREAIPALFIQRTDDGFKVHPTAQFLALTQAGQRKD